METRSNTRRRRDSDAESVGSTASEPAIISRSRSTTPFTLRSQCSRHGSECPEGHGINFRSRLSPSPKRSTKKSPHRAVTQSSNSRKNLLTLIEESTMERKRKTSASTLIASVKPLAKTSDYSSGEEEISGKKKTNGTPTNTSQTVCVTLSPLQRSAEKTGFTYAESLSYRTEVTPDREILMPNMARQAIQRDHTDWLSSPNLNTSSSIRHSTYLSSSTNVSHTKYSSSPAGYKARYGTDREYDDSDAEIEQSHLEAYQLNAPPSSGSIHVKTASALGVSYRIIRETLFSLLWWIYLVTCYSLLLDTHILQSKGISKLRHMCKQQAKNIRLLLLLFFLTPLCFSAGGLIYSATLHALNLRLPDKSGSNPAVDVNLNIPGRDVNHHSSPPSIVMKPPEIDSVTTTTVTEEELTTARAKLATVEGKMSELDEKLGSLGAALGSLRAQLVAVEAKSKACCDETSSEALSSLVDAKVVAALADQLADHSRPSADDLAVVLGRLRTLESELESLHEWKNTEKHMRGTMSEELAELRESVETRDRAISDMVAAQVEKAILKWERDARTVWFNELKEVLMNEVTEKIKVLDSKSGRGLSRDEVERLIHSALGLYDSDKTGLADYALEPAGGVVLSTRCTEAFSSHRPRVSIWGFSLWSEPNNPRVVIQPGIVPGQCWSFRGFDGYLVIQLSRRITPTAFTMEHIPKSLAPDGQIDSAPRNFTVYGLSRETDSSGVPLGHYTYDNAGEPLQTFQVQAQNPGSFHIVELRIHSNYGNMNYTCLYRFRVHGQVAP